MGGPLFFGTEGWRLVPGHFAERHGLIVLIALGESIVAIGLGANHTVDAGVVAAAVGGTVVAAGLWWTVLRRGGDRRRAAAGASSRRRAQNAMARDLYSYLHLPMVVGIVLVSLGMKKTLAHVEDPLTAVPAFALLGGVAVYLLAHVAFRYRGGRTLVAGGSCLRSCSWHSCRRRPTLRHSPTLAVLAALLVCLIAYETHSYGALPARIRHELRARQTRTERVFRRLTPSRRAAWAR